MNYDGNYSIQNRLHDTGRKWHLISANEGLKATLRDHILDDFRVQTIQDEENQ